MGSYCTSLYRFTIYRNQHPSLQLALLLTIAIITLNHLCFTYFTTYIAPITLLLLLFHLIRYFILYTSYLYFIYIHTYFFPTVTTQDLGYGLGYPGSCISI